MLTEVGWSWLLESLDERGALSRAESGTVTRTASESFGAIEDRPPSGDVEIRASWTPGSPDIGPHLHAWADVLAQVAGLPPLPLGVASLPLPRVAPSPAARPVRFCPDRAPTAVRVADE